MVRHANENSNRGSENGYRVELPRIHDAIGVVLRDAYARDADIPDDMAHLLRRMNGGSHMGR